MRQARRICTRTFVVVIRSSSHRDVQPYMKLHSQHTTSSNAAVGSLLAWCDAQQPTEAGQTDETPLIAWRATSLANRQDPRLVSRRYSKGTLQRIAAAKAKARWSTEFHVTYVRDDQIFMYPRVVVGVCLNALRAVHSRACWEVGAMLCCDKQTPGTLPKSCARSFFPWAALLL